MEKKMVLLALNSEELELVIAHGAQLRDAAFVHACRCTCRRLREATAPWVSFYAEPEKRTVDVGPAVCRAQAAAGSGGRAGAMGGARRFRWLSARA